MHLFLHFWRPCRRRRANIVKEVLGQIMSRISKLSNNNGNSNSRKSGGTMLLVLVPLVVVAMLLIGMHQRSLTGIDPQSLLLLTQQTTSLTSTSDGSNSNNHKDASKCAPPLGLRPMKNRDELGSILQEHNFTTGVEVGVKQGKYAEIILKQWTKCKNYKLVDLWAHQQNYKDLANVANEQHENFFQETKRRLAPYKHITEYYRMYSTQAAQQIAPASLDFAYIDARHDYCGVTDDLNAYWPLIKPGGIMAGHDFVSDNEVRGQDWSLCEDGRVFPQAVKGAVLEFAMPRGLTVSVTYGERHFFSWMIQKPMC